jgi:hypothetical protein
MLLGSKATDQDFDVTQQQEALSKEIQNQLELYERVLDIENRLKLKSSEPETMGTEEATQAIRNISDSDPFPCDLIDKPDATSTPTIHTACDQTISEDRQALVVENAGKQDLPNESENKLTEKVAESYEKNTNIVDQKEFNQTEVPKYVDAPLFETSLQERDEDYNNTQTADNQQGIQSSRNFLKN